MMRLSRSFSTLLISSLCLLLIYTLAISLIAPFAMKPTEAAIIDKTITDSATMKAPAPFAVKAQEQKSRWRAGEILVRFREHAPISKMNALLRANGAQWNGRLRGQSGIERIRLSGGADPEVVAASFRSSELIAFAEPNYLLTADQTTTEPALNDPRFAEQWALQSIRAQRPSATTAASRQTVIAIIDSGIDFSHPELINSQWNNSLEQDNNRDNDGNGFTSDLHGWDFVTNLSRIVDEQGHGTAVAGIVAAEGDNRTGIAGVMWRASLMSLRILDHNGTGDIAAAVEAIDYATSNGAQVINCAWGTGAASLALREAINRAGQLGVIVITSAGNSSQDIETAAHYPASYDLPNLLAVASTDKTDSLTQFSNWGATHVSIAAPGKEILTTKSGGDYQTMSGTSLSASFVTGVAGLIKTLRPWLGAKQTREMILRGARPVHSLADKVACQGIVSATGASEVLKTLPPQEGLDETSDNNGGEHVVTENGRARQRRNRSGDSHWNTDKNLDGKEFMVTPPARTVGAPGLGLPNLDELRHKQPLNPQTPAPIPSTRCSHKNPDCASFKRKAVIEPVKGLLAWGLNFQLMPTLFADDLGSVSDSPFQLFGSLQPSLPAPRPQPQANRINVALAANGSTASASSTNVYNGNPFPASRAIDGDRLGLNYLTGGVWHSSNATFPQWLQIDFPASKTIDEIDLFMVQDAYANPIEPTEALPFTWYGLTAFEVQYWNGSSWVTVPGGSAMDNHKVWRKFTFPSITTSKIRVLTNASIDGYSRITEIEAWETPANAPVNSFSTERLDPHNRTGYGGVDLLSGNVNWSLPLLGLKGRAGLNLGLSLSYNSLVWTKSQDGTAIKFDADQGTPAPGFRLGFPVIQQRYYNSQVGVNAYLLITPSGAHVELRQVGTSNVYESADSSYLQLIDNGNNLTLRPTDGSQLSYNLINGQYHCTRIKDRNGNFITINYDAINGLQETGQLTSIVDTLGRIINFNYDAYLNLNSITQSWGALTHTWATFGWDNQAINTSFPGLTVVGPQNGTKIPVLTQVAFADETRYSFEYNSYAQVSMIRHYAADKHQVAYTSYTLTPSSSDCPRASAQQFWAEHWNGNLEATTSYSTAHDFSSGQTTLPDGNIHKEIFATSGWQKGLTLGTEFWAGGVKKKWTTTTYTQDDTNLHYGKNPRIIETNVYDSDNKHKRTKINYDLYASYGLPHYVDEYAADGVTLLRRTYTDYNLSQAYLDRRIIGLTSAVHISDGTGWQVKVKYEYDAGGDQLQPTSTPTTQHDASYGSGFILGRGNLTSVSRYNAEDSNNESLKLVTSTGYDTNGSIIFTRDPLGHQSRISYTDSFSDGVNHHTYAYPTTIKDAEHNSSSIQYNYDFGAPTRTETPPPAGHAEGVIQTFEYDGAGRPTRVNNLVNKDFRRWVYDAYGAIITYTTVQAGAPETFQVTYLDGAGRVRAQGSDLPDSIGLYRGQYFDYDIMGRVSQTSYPGEMNSNWKPAGEDAAGWVWTRQAYDWKGRPTMTTNPDGTTKEITYGGCGCAGGEVVTVRDEVGRRQRMTADILGRPLKTEVLNRDVNNTVYSATTNTYNARDQITRVYDEGNGVKAQTTTLTYDGYGRLKTKQVPSQSHPTTYVYNEDDTVKSVTDARGVVSTFAYNDRHLPTGIKYSAPAGIAASADVTFAYDAMGNRTSMSDGSGSVAYSYDRLSRLTSEARQFNGLSRTYTLAYSYNLAGSLTSITDPFGAIVNYSYDMTGRMTGITGSAFAGVTRYASDMRYRAWGAVKSATYGDHHSLSASYNLRRLATDFSISDVISKHYEYNADGRLRYSQHIGDDRFDRSYTYDHAGRVTEAFSGPLARREADSTDRPYKLSYAYDALGHLTSRTGRVWNTPHEANVGSGIYLDGKNTGWQYDADGRLTDSTETEDTYDAAGRAITVVSAEGALTQMQTFDGDGARTRLTTQTPSESETQYFVRSSVLNQVVTELNPLGQKTRTFVYQGDQVLAWQQKFGTVETLVWEHRDLSNASVRMMGAAAISEAAELEPMGSNAGLGAPELPPGHEQYPLEYEPTYPGFGNVLSDECRVNGINTPCEIAQRLIGAGATATESMFFNNEGWHRRQTPLTAIGLGMYGHYEGTGGGVDREWDGVWGSPDGAVVNVSQETRRFVVDGVIPRTQNTPLTRDELELLRSDLNDLLGDSRCKDFVRGTLAQLNAMGNSAYDTTDPMDIFNHVLSSGGIVKRELVSNHKAEAVVTVNGKARTDRFVKIQIDPRRVPLNKLSTHFSVAGRGGTLIHELMHAAGFYGYQHQDMATAAKSAALALGYKNVPELPDQRDYPGKDGRVAFDKANSSYYGALFERACYRGPTGRR